MSVQPKFGKIIVHDISMNNHANEVHNYGSDSFDVRLTDDDTKLKPSVAVSDRYTLSRLKPDQFPDQKGIFAKVDRIFMNAGNSSIPIRDDHTEAIDIVAEDLPDHFRVILHNPWDKTAEIRWQEGGHGNFEMEASVTRAELKPLVSALVKGKTKKPDETRAQKLIKADRTYRTYGSEWTQRIVNQMVRYPNITFPVLEAKNIPFYPQSFQGITDVFKRFNDWTNGKVPFATIKKEPNPTRTLRSRLMAMTGFGS